MHADKTTIADLSIFHHEEEQSVFHHLNFTQTNEGREYLKHLLQHPLNSIDEINDTQLLIQHLQTVSSKWTNAISNGTIMVMDKFFDTPVDAYPSHPSATNSFLYKVISGSDFSLTKYSVEHFINFIKGMNEIIVLLNQTKSKQLQTWCEKIQLLLNKPVIHQMQQWKKEDKLSPANILFFGNFIRHQFKHDSFELINIYSRLDAYLSLATASTKYDFTFPNLTATHHPFITAKKLYHPLLHSAVSYDVELTKEKNFLFLTGANMAGKSTFIKAIGVSVYMAHIGMAVPAQEMQLSWFDGLLSNINVVDNLAKGESYFFNEVQRIKSTIERISNGKNWLILIDELFKGTNVQDAMKCSTAVIEGFRKMNNALFILSTHLYEIGDDLKQYSNIQFKYFETTVEGEQLVFSYQLKDGVSNDRLGYLILKKEGIVEMLQKL
jgi:DNA mismatch repair ATPase MutS